MRLISLLPLTLILYASPGALAAEKGAAETTGPAMLFDFESGDLQGWRVVEGEFDRLICDRDVFHNQASGAYNKQGRFFLSTVELANGGSDDGMTGVLESPTFVLKGGKFSFLVGGGFDENVYVALHSEDGETVGKAGGSKTEIMQRVGWDVRPWIGKRLFLRIVDRSQGGWGHITLDDVRADAQIDLDATNTRFAALERLRQERKLERFKVSLAKSHDSLRRAIEHLERTQGERYGQGDAFRARLDAITARAENCELEEIDALQEGYRQLQWDALVAENPVLDFDELVLVRRRQLMGGSHYAYTEAVSWAGDRERHFKPPAALCTLAFKEPGQPVKVLLDSPQGVIRDPDVSWDGTRILFAHKRDLNGDDYHLYEYGVKTEDIRTLTDDEGFADYEGAYLPDGRIAFNSTRCVQTVPCWKTPVSNLYVMEADGSHIRRISLNQVHDNFPSVMNDGRVLYTRWEYNDRGQLWLQGLFSMNPDGTGNTAYYGNNSWWPVTMIHARSIPGSSRIVATLCGHHTDQSGEIGIFDVSLGNEEAEGCVQLWPERPVEPIHVETYTRGLKTRYQYPFPLSENFFLVSCMPEGRQRYGVYLIDTFGNQVRIYEDERWHCSSPMPLRERERPPAIPTRARYAETEGTVYMADVYRGSGLKGVPRGTVKALRIVEILFRAFGSPGSGLAEYGPGGGGGLFPPMGLESSWDAKRVVGTVPVEEDGSALFTVPANAALVVEPLDENGKALQKMRSWMSVMPGETLACVGCHEGKHEAPPKLTRNVQGRKPVKPTPWQVSDRAFAFHEDIQPLLDRNCIGCHNQDHPQGIDLRGDKTDAFSLGYEHLVGYVKTPGAQDVPHLIPPRSTGAIASPLIELLENGLHDVRLAPQEMDRLITWIDLNTNYYATYALTRPHAHIGRCAVPEPEPLFEALGDTCGACHKDGFNWRKTGSSYNRKRSVLVNLTHAEQSRILRAPLAKEAGGLGLHKQSPFQDKSDPRYQAALQIVQQWSDALGANPREDMPGAKPAPEYTVWLEKRKESDRIEACSREALAAREK